MYYPFLSQILWQYRQLRVNKNTGSFMKKHWVVLINYHSVIKTTIERNFIMIMEGVFLIFHYDYGRCFSKAVKVVNTPRHINYIYGSSHIQVINISDKFWFNKYRSVTGSSKGWKKKKKLTYHTSSKTRQGQAGVGLAVPSIENCRWKMQPIMKESIEEKRRIT